MNGKSTFLNGKWESAYAGCRIFVAVIFSEKQPPNTTSV